MDEIEALERLTALRDKGALTEDEFCARKAALFAGPSEAAANPTWIENHRFALIAVVALLLVALVAAVAIYTTSKEAPKTVEGLQKLPPAVADSPPPIAPSTPSLPRLAEQTLHEWNEADDGEKRAYRVGDVVLKFAAKSGVDDSKSTVVTLSTPGVADKSFTFNTNWAGAKFGAGLLDPTQKGPQIMLTTFSGGAHCCTEISVATAVNGRWNISSLGSWDGEGPAQWPKDLDGDGGADFELVDQSFLYAFASYAESWPPPMVLGFRGGKAVDLSAKPAFRSLYEADMISAMKSCEQKNNSACAAFVANAARLGRKDWAWQIMLAFYDSQSNWELPSGCLVKSRDGTCPAEMEIKFDSYPAALDWFLRENGYL